MRLESGPAAGDRNYYGIFALVLLGFSGWFLYDGQVGYGKKNAEAAATWLTSLEGVDMGLDEAKKKVAEFPDAPSKDEFETIVKKLQERADAREPITPALIQESLGEPVHVRASGSEETRYYASKYIHVTAVFSGNRLKSELVGEKFFKDKAEVKAQFYWALIPLLGALYFVYRTIAAITLKAAIDDEGLTYRSAKIPFEQMHALKDYNPKGWIDLYYGDAANPKKLRIDNQKIAKFEEIINEICKEKGFENELRAYEAEKAAREDDEAVPAGVEGDNTADAAKPDADKPDNPA